MGKTMHENAVAAPFAAEKLRLAGLRPTRQRLELASHLFGGPDRHVMTSACAGFRLPP